MVVFYPTQDVWLPRNTTLLNLDISIPRIVSDEKVDGFVKSLDIGHVSPIPNYPGVSHTITGLVYMILNLNVSLQHFHKKLMWFNENEYNIFQFSDDGAPETSALGMSISSLTC